MSTDTWYTAFSLKEVQDISKNTLLTTLPLLKKEWKVSFDFKANNLRGLGQIFHMTAGGKGLGAGAAYGDRTPAIWVHSSRGFLVSSAVDGKYSFAKYFKPLPTIGEWTTIEVGQELVGSRIVYSISIGGKKVLSVTNSKPSEFKNVKVYASTDWYSSASGSIKNLAIQSKNDGESILILKTISHVLALDLVDEDGCLIDWAPVFSLPSSEHLLKKNDLLATLPTLAKEWRLSFEIKPENYTHRSYGQVIHLTQGEQFGHVGDRTPALWFHKSRGVYLVTTLNGQANVGKFFRNSLPTPGVWTRFEISQTKVGSSYIFSLYIAGEEVWSVTNTKPREFSDIKVYAASPWYRPQNGSIRDFQIENKLRGIH